MPKLDVGYGRRKAVDRRKIKTGLCDGFREPGKNIARFLRVRWRPVAMGFREKEIERDEARTTNVIYSKFEY